MNTCRKNIFSTKEAAQEIGQVVVRMGRAKRNRVYYCNACKGWHLTSMTLKDHKKRKDHGD